jgi:hypothetical protein
VARMVAGNRVSVPTLTMMESIAGAVEKSGAGDHGLTGKNRPDYGAARASVTALYRAGVPILAGTDANPGAPGVSASPRYGESLHHELELPIDAGLSTLRAGPDRTLASSRQPALDDCVHRAPLLLRIGSGFAPQPLQPGTAAAA